jgi:hypothetical protein
LDHCKPKQFTEWRKPFARIPDEKDDWQECYVCLGDGETWSSADQEYRDCGFCPDSKGKLPYLPNQVFVTVYRGGHSIETLATVLDSGEVNAWVSLSQPGFPYGREVPLTDAEKDLARQTLKGGKP